MRFDTKQHQFYCGIDLHARAMYVCILNQRGEILVHRNLTTSPETFLNVIAPYREGSSSRSNACSRGTGWPTSVLTKAFLSSSAMPCT